MNLYIRIKNGQPIDHPILEDNFKKAFPNIDVNNLPSEFAKFKRVSLNLGHYEVCEGSSYEWQDGVVKDVWHIRPMTEQEKADKIAKALENKPFPSWTFEEESFSWLPPVEYPKDGKEYLWNEETLSWILIE